jgi:hypothetical protein
MRQAVRALIVGGVLLSAAACGTVNNPPPGGSGVGVGSATAPPAAERSAEAAARSSCEALGRVYSRYMAPYAQSLTELVAARNGDGDAKKGQQEVRTSLKAFATAIRGATQDNPDPQVRTDGKRAADTLQAKADDAGTFTAIKTNEDVNKAVGATLQQWLSPVNQHCT